MPSLLPPLPPDLWLPPPVPPPPPPPADESRILIVRLIMAFALSMFAVFLCGCGKGYRNSRARAAAAELESHARNGELQLRAGGRTHTAARLPAFKYSRTVKHKVTGGGGEEAATTCSVCLGAFQLGEKVRLLPACLHLYHAECIDPWLDAHSTCPICRSDTDPAVGVGQVPPV